MIKAIRAAIKYSDALPLAIELIEEIQRSVRDDGSISNSKEVCLMYVKKITNILGVLERLNKVEKNQENYITRDEIKILISQGKLQPQSQKCNCSRS